MQSFCKVIINKVFVKLLLTKLLHALTLARYFGFCTEKIYAPEKHLSTGHWKPRKSEIFPRVIFPQGYYDDHNSPWARGRFLRGGGHFC